MTTQPRQRGRGFTLAEALLAATILSIVIAAVVYPFSIAAQSQQAEARATLAAFLARDMMEEVLSKPFNDPDGPSNSGPEAGETSRSRFDNMDDYHGLVEAPGAIVGSDGKTVSGVGSGDVSRAVTTSYVRVAGQAASDPIHFIVITVEVRYKGDTLLLLTRLVYSPDVHNGGV